MVSSDFLFGAIGLALGILSSFIGTAKYAKEVKAEAKKRIEEEKQRYAENEVKRYAAERDFNHLRRDFEQLRTGQATLLKEVELETEKLALEITKLSTRMDDFEKLLKSRLSV